MADWRLPPEEDRLWGHGWTAEREHGRCTVSTPTGKCMEGELSFAISEAEFEQLRAEPDAIHDIVRRYNEVRGDGWTAQREDKCIVYLEPGRFPDNRRFCIPNGAFEQLRGDPSRFDEIYQLHRDAHV